MNYLSEFKRQACEAYCIDHKHHGAVETIEDLERLVLNIRQRPLKTLNGFWFNLVEYRGQQFLQGDLCRAPSRESDFRPIAALGDGIRRDDIEGFWPEAQGYLISESEAARIASYLSRQGPNDVELIVPERNTARPVAWGRFDESQEFETYREFIYPAVIGAVTGIDLHRKHAGISFCMDCLLGSKSFEQEGPLRLLDMGCGCGDLIAAIQCAGSAEKQETRWEVCGCGNLMQVHRVRFPAMDCFGIDTNSDNIDAAQQKGIGSILQGDGEDIETLLPPGAMFDIIVFCGLLNRQVTSREKAGRILQGALRRLNCGGHLIVTGYTSCHFTASDFCGFGLEVLRKSIPENIFRDYRNYWLRQLYLARKI